MVMPEMSCEPVRREGRATFVSQGCSHHPILVSQLMKILQLIHPLFTDLLDAWDCRQVAVYEMNSLDGSGTVPDAQAMYLNDDYDVTWPVQEIEVKVTPQTSIQLFTVCFRIRGNR